MNEIVRTVRIEDKSKFVMKGDPRPRSIFETAEGELRFNLCGKEGNQGDYQYAGMVLLLFDLTEYPDLGRVEKVVEKDPHTLLAYSRDDRERYYVFFRVESGLDEHIKMTRSAKAYFTETYGMSPSLIITRVRNLGH